jgi:hypothetical protein
MRGRVLRLLAAVAVATTFKALALAYAWVAPPSETPGQTASGECSMNSIDLHGQNAVALVLAALIAAALNASARGKPVRIRTHGMVSLGAGRSGDG